MSYEVLRCWCRLIWKFYFDSGISSNVAPSSRSMKVSSFMLAMTPTTLNFWVRSVNTKCSFPANGTRNETSTLSSSPFPERKATNSLPVGAGARSWAPEKYTITQFTESPSKAFLISSCFQTGSALILSIICFGVKWYAFHLLLVIPVEAGLGFGVGEAGGKTCCIGIGGAGLSFVISFGASGCCSVHLQAMQPADTSRHPHNQTQKIAAFFSLADQKKEPLVTPSIPVTRNQTIAAAGFDEKRMLAIVSVIAAAPPRKYAATSFL